VRNIYLGPPGTGKTSKLLELVDNALEIGTPSRYIGYFAFTRAANEESINRACTKFQLSRKDLPFFRTLHSLAFRQLGLKSNQVMGDQHYQEFGEWLGLRISGGLDRDTGVFYGNERGDEILALINKARIRDISVEHQWYDDSSDISWLEVERVDRALRLYKERREIVDYTDMLSLFLIQKPVPFLETIFIDEAQDLNRLQWKMVYLLEEVSKNCVIAGDDDQAIFKWAGADVDQFLDLTGRTTVLDKSFRLPNKIANFAKSIVKRIDRRYEKEWSSRDDEGLLEYHTKFDYINMSKGEWLVLARTHYLLQPIEAQ
jgi:DNA helicase-2/ATP-dependent DNA helicase PcrA